MIQILNGIDATAAALKAERIRMDVVAENLANINTTRGPGGKAYQRQQVVFESVLRQQQLAGGAAGAGPALQSVQVARIETDARLPRIVIDPNHPHRDAQNRVAYPDINVHEEMADLIAASRSFEANLAAIRTARSMALQTLAIGKR